MYIWKNEQKWTLKNPEDFSSGLASGAVLWLGMELLLLLFPGYPGKLVERFGKEVRRDRNNPGNQILQD